jgi:hypothetical protein
MSRPGRTFHFPRGSRVLTENPGKNLMKSMGHSCPDNPAVSGKRSD